MFIPAEATNPQPPIGDERLRFLNCLDAAQRTSRALELSGPGSRYPLGSRRNAHATILAAGQRRARFPRSLDPRLDIGLLCINYIARTPTIEMVKRTDDMKGFVVLPKRWIGERTFGWLGKYRLLSKEYERTLQSSKTDIFLAMISLMLRRLTTPADERKEARKS